MARRGIPGRSGTSSATWRLGCPSRWMPSAPSSSMLIRALIPRPSSAPGVRSTANSGRPSRMVSANGRRWDGLRRGWAVGRSASWPAPPRSASFPRRRLLLIRCPPTHLQAPRWGWRPAGTFSRKGWCTGPGQGRRRREPGKSHRSGTSATRPAPPAITRRCSSGPRPAAAMPFNALEDALVHLRETDPEVFAGEGRERVGVADESLELGEGRRCRRDRAAAPLGARPPRLTRRPPPARER